MVDISQPTIPESDFERQQRLLQVQPQPRQFDVQGAKEAGFSDAQIADALAQQNNFNVAGARQAGFDDANIIQTLTTGRPFREIGQAGAFAEGVNRGVQDFLSTIAGLPVDIATTAVNALGDITAGLTGRRPFEPFAPKEQFAGSASIQRGLTAALEPVGGERRPIEDIRPEFRPAGIAGEVFGGAAIPIAAPFAAAKGIGVLKPVVRLAQEAPKRFLAAELGAVAGSAQLAAGAEFLDPGDPVTRFVAEVAGGFFTPASLITRVGGKGIEGVKTLFKSIFTKSGSENKAARVIQDIVSEAGENPDDIIALLNKADIAGPLTSGQKTGSPALLAIEARLSARSGKFAGEAEELATSSFKILRELTDNLTRSGDPQALRVAAKLRATYFDDLLTRRIEDAGQEALEARAAIGTETRADLANVSIKAKNILGDALKDARTIETSLWEKIPKETPLAPNSLIARFDDVKSRLLPEESLPPIAESFVARMRSQVSEGKASNAGELLTFRSRMLALGREARAKQNFSEASQFGELADGALDDLFNLPGETAINARAFSRQLHEKFTNTFAGNVLGTSKQGGQRIPAEIMLERAFGSGGTRGELQLRQLEQAADFPNQVFGEPMLSAQERFLRIAAQNTLETGTGRVNPNKLQDFISRNEVTLNRFPELRKTLGDATIAEQAFRGVEVATQRATKAIQQRVAFSNLIKTDDPVVAVSDILTSKNTRRNFTQIAKLAKRSGPGAVDGLRSSTLQSVFNKSTNNAGDFSFRRVDQILKRGLSGEKQGVLSLMMQNGVIDSAGVNRLKMIVGRAIDIEDALGNQKKLDKLLDNPDALFDLVTRIVGARVGAAGLSGQATGSSLIVASASSRFARNFAQKIPATKVNEVLELAAKDPKFMSMLLKKTKTIKQRAEIERQINAFLISAGLQLDEEPQ